MSLFTSFDGPVTRDKMRGIGKSFRWNCNQTAFFWEFFRELFAINFNSVKSFWSHNSDWTSFIWFALFDKEVEKYSPKNEHIWNIFFFVLIATVIYAIPTSVTCETEMKWNIYDVWDGT